MNRYKRRLRMEAAIRIVHVATPRQIFKFRMGLVGHLSQVERKSSSMQKKEKEEERQGERAGGSDHEGKRKRR